MRNENFSGVCLRCREAFRKCTAVIDFQVLLLFFFAVHFMVRTRGTRFTRYSRSSATRVTLDIKRHDNISFFKSSFPKWVIVIVKYRSRRLV